MVNYNSINFVFEQFFNVCLNLTYVTVLLMLYSFYMFYHYFIYSIASHCSHNTHFSPSLIPFPRNACRTSFHFRAEPHVLRVFPALPGWACALQFNKH